MHRGPLQRGRGSTDRISRHEAEAAATMNRTPSEIPPPVASSFITDMKAYCAEDNPLKRDEIAERQVRALNEHRRPRDLKMRLVDVKNLFELAARVDAIRLKDKP